MSTNVEKINEIETLSDLNIRQVYMNSIKDAIKQSIERDQEAIIKILREALVSQGDKTVHTIMQDLSISERYGITFFGGKEGHPDRIKMDGRWEIPADRGLDND